MTDIDNLDSILKHGLLSRNDAYEFELLSIDISALEVQNLRADKREPIYGRCLHDYVPLYFSPRNAMLYVNQEIQERIVILGIDPNVLLNPNTIFSDGNAAAQNTTFYRDAAKLDELPWNIINGQYWNDFEDGKRIKCAEVLVYPEVEVQSILTIFCYSDDPAEFVAGLIFDEIVYGNNNISVRVNQALCF